MYICCENNFIYLFQLILRRYIDDIFLTWNRSQHELEKLLNEANQWHPNIKLEYTISQSLPFLDVLLTNTNGILLTSVYHKPSAEPYMLFHLFLIIIHMYFEILLN